MNYFTKQYQILHKVILISSHSNNNKDTLRMAANDILLKQPITNIKPRLIILSICTVIFIVGFVINLTSDQSLYNYNLEVVPQMQNNASLGSDAFIIFMNLISNLFNPVICAGYIILFYLISYRKLQILVFLIWFIFLSFVLSILKEAIQQPRPYWNAGSGVKMLEWTCYTEYGCPSGHAMLGLVLMEFIIRFFSRVHQAVSNHMWVFYIILVVMELLVMFSRVILGMHTFNQVLMGAMIGVYTLIPYYFFVQAWLLTVIIKIFEKKNDLHVLLTLFILILINFLIALLVTLLPSYPTENYEAVILNTSGCEHTKMFKSFQYKCLQDSAIIMAAFGAMFAFVFLKNPSALVNQLSYSRLTLKFVAKFLITVIASIIPIAVFYNPLWQKIDLDPESLSLLIWACQTIGFFLAVIVLIDVTPLINGKIGYESYKRGGGFDQYCQFQTFYGQKIQHNQTELSVNGEQRI